MLVVARNSFLVPWGFLFELNFVFARCVGDKNIRILTLNSGNPCTLVSGWIFESHRIVSGTGRSEMIEWDMYYAMRFISLHIRTSLGAVEH